MPSWKTFAEEAPELAREVERRLAAHKHKTIATLRKDGSPRVSGTESEIAIGDVWIGSMPGSLKARDLARDPRYALHSGSDDPPDWTGDAKLAGRAEEVEDPETVAAVYAESEHAPTPGEFHLFRLDLDEASVVELNEAGDGIRIRLWKAGQGTRTIDRDG